MRSLDGFNESFIGFKERENPDYAFLGHFRYFVCNSHRWANSSGILNRILAPVPTNSDEAWEIWSQFRSAQAEVTSIFVVEHFFHAQVEEIEAAKLGVAKSCDIRARFPDCPDLFIEVKAQSGQQHGDKHPLSVEPIGFTPRFESDLRSWLFEEKISAKTGELMKPYCRQAAEKSADVLVAISDIFRQDQGDLCSLARRLVPDHQGTVEKASSGELMCNLLIVEGGESTSTKMCGLPEVWLMDMSRLDEVLVIHSSGGKSILEANA